MKRQTKDTIKVALGCTGIAILAAAAGLGILYTVIWVVSTAWH